jgi:hypothetical protein
MMTYFLWFHLNAAKIKLRKLHLILDRESFISHIDGLDNNIKLEVHNETFWGLCCVFVYGLVGGGFSLKTAAVVCLHSSSFQDFLDLLSFSD